MTSRPFQILEAPESTAVRVALWRALHLELDDAPPILRDPFGALWVDEPAWRERPDMAPAFSKPMRASIVGRARFIEDQIAEAYQQGVRQYVILGAGLDSFAFRCAEALPGLRIFELDQAGPQRWKQRRLRELGMKAPATLQFVPVDLERGASWWGALLGAGFDPQIPAVVVSTGVSMYLTREANLATLREAVGLAPGSLVASTFLLPPEHLEASERATLEFVMKRAAESGTPFLSLFSPDSMRGLAHEAGFALAEVVLAEVLFQRYFAGRRDGLRAGNAECFLIARTC